MILDKEKLYTSTRNACKLCTPLGACVAFKGVKGCVPLIHGSQGCATYIRRYMISHYREPVDIASSSFSEESAIFGGNKNFNTGITNIIDQYKPEVIAITSTCLSETIGEDIGKLIKEYKAINAGDELPEFVYASTPSYQGTHMDGFHEAVFALVKTFAEPGRTSEAINIFPGFVSPEDLRHIKRILADFRIQYIMIPDYSLSLDNPNWDDYTRIPEGGTPVDVIRESGKSLGSIEFGNVFNKGALAGRIREARNLQTAGEYLEHKFDVINHQTGLPIGINQTDRFFELLSKISDKPVPEKYRYQRGRLIDSYVDGHKYCFGKKAVVYGEEDLVISLTGFLQEIGIDVVLAATGGESNSFHEKINSDKSDNTKEILTRSGADFETIHELSKELKPDIFIGNSKAYYITRELGIPLIRIGFPIHDRIGAQRQQCLGYEGTQQLYDRLVNALLEYKQEKSAVGYKYL